MAYTFVYMCIHSSHENCSYWMLGPYMAVGGGGEALAVAFEPTSTINRYISLNSLYSENKSCCVWDLRYKTAEFTKEY